MHCFLVCRAWLFDRPICHFGQWQYSVKNDRILSIDRRRQQRNSDLSAKRSRRRHSQIKTVFNRYESTTRTKQERTDHEIVRAWCRITKFFCRNEFIFRLEAQTKCLLVYPVMIDNRSYIGSVTVTGLWQLRVAKPRLSLWQYSVNPWSACQRDRIAPLRRYSVILWQMLVTTDRYLSWLTEYCHWQNTVTKMVSLSKWQNTVIKALFCHYWQAPVTIDRYLSWLTDTCHKWQNTVFDSILSFNVRGYSSTWFTRDNSGILSLWQIGYFCDSILSLPVEPLLWADE